MIASVEKTGDGGYAEKGTRLAFRFSRHQVTNWHGYFYRIKTIGKNQRLTSWGGKKELR
jgi:hypothetical protein